MKRFITAVMAAALALSAFADTDEDRVLDEARRRAAASRDAARDASRDASHDAAEERRSASDDEAVYLPIALSVLPGSPIPGTPVDASIGLGLIIGSLRNVNGVQASGIGSIADGDVNGAQLAYIFNVVDGEMNGFQGSNIFNVAGSTVNGAQMAAVFNTAEGAVGGAQLAGVFNVSGGGGPLQAAGVFNVAEGRAHGLQTAGVFNIADAFSGVQLAGVFNVAEELRGVQIGVVNVADTAYGVQIGLINIVRNGINDMGVWFEDSGYAYAFWQKGTSNVYTIAYVGAPGEDWFSRADRLAGGLGLGVRWGGARRWLPSLDLDVSAKGRIDIEAIEDACEEKTDYRPDIFPSGRLSVRIPLGIGAALHAGVVVDAEILNGPRVTDEFREADAWSASAFDLDWTFHPKLFLGLSL